MQVTLVPNFQMEYSVQLASGLADLADVTLVAWDSVAPEALSFVDPRVGLVRVGAPGERWWTRLMAQREIARWVSQHPSDVVHVQNAYAWNIPFLRALSRSALVVTVHDPFPHHGLPDPWSFPSIALHGLTADAFVVHGTAQLAQFTSRFDVDATKVYVIPHGDFSYYDRFVADAGTENRTILLIGRIAAYKGIGIFLRAAQAASRKSNALRFRIVGEGDLGPYKHLLSQVPNIEVENRSVTAREFAREISQAAIVVAPYIESSQSGVVIAAQSLGRPVIATRVGGLPEDMRAGETGLLVAPGDVKALGDAIAELMGDPDRRHVMGAKARTWMTAERSWKRIAIHTMALYEAVA
jgi:glycosyltransferase involved in cell wall biosynthesis